MEGKAQFSRERAGKGQIAVGLLAAQAMVQMGGVQHQAQLLAPLRQRAHQGHGVSATGEANGQAQARLEQRGVENERRGRRGAHSKIIMRQCGYSPSMMR